MPSKRKKNSPKKPLKILSSAEIITITKELCDISKLPEGSDVYFSRLSSVIDSLSTFNLWDPSFSTKKSLENLRSVLHQTIKLEDTENFIFPIECILIELLCYYEENNDETSLKKLLNTALTYKSALSDFNNPIFIEFKLQINNNIIQIINCIFNINISSNCLNENDVLDNIITSYKPYLNDENCLYINEGLSDYNNKKRIISLILNKQRLAFQTSELEIFSEESTDESKIFHIDLVKKYVENVPSKANFFYPKYCRVLAELYNPSFPAVKNFEKNINLACDFYKQSLEHCHALFKVEFSNFYEIEKTYHYIDDCLSLTKLLMGSKRPDAAIPYLKEALAICNLKAKNYQPFAKESGKLLVYAAKAHMIKGELALDHLERNKFLTTASLFLQDSLKKGPSQEASYCLALTRILQDTHLKLVQRNDSIEIVFHSTDILSHPPESNPAYQYVNEVKKLFEAADNPGSFGLMALFYLKGLYFEKNIEKALECYAQFSKKSGCDLIGFQTYLSFEKYLEESSFSQKYSYLEDFLFSKFLDEESLKKTADDKEYITKYSSIFDKIYQKKEPCKNGFFDKKNHNDYKSYLHFILDNDITKDNTQAFVEASKFMSYLIKKSFPYDNKDFIENLFNAKEKLTANYLMFTPQERNDLIEALSHWPIADDHQVLFSLNNHLGKDEETIPFVFFSNIFSMQYYHQKSVHKKQTLKHNVLAYTNTLINAENPPKENIKNVTNILFSISRLLISYSNITEESFSNILIDLVSEIIPILLENFEKYKVYLTSVHASRCYHAIIYLQCLYNFPLSVDTSVYFENISKYYRENVRPSKQQTEVHAMLLKIYPDILHECFVGGRSVDFYIEKTKEIIQFNGPSHYIYDKNKMPVKLNDSSLLSQKTLENQGYKVIHISYLEWEGVKNNPEKCARFLREKIPSCYRQEIASSTSIEIKKTEDSSDFWKAFCT